MSRSEFRPSPQLEKISLGRDIVVNGPFDGIYAVNFSPRAATSRWRVARRAFFYDLIDPAKPVQVGRIDDNADRVLNMDRSPGSAACHRGNGQRRVPGGLEGAPTSASS